MQKIGGVEEGGAIVCRKEHCAKGLVAFGPYTRAVPPGPRVATFRVSGRGVAGLDHEVVALDVYDALGKQRLGFRSVMGPELPDRKEQGIELAFLAPAQSNLEFRVGWSGDGDLAMYRVDVR
jgi:hypothetical protein